MKTFIAIAISLLLVTVVGRAQEPQPAQEQKAAEPSKPAPQPRPARPQRQIVLGPNDKPAFPAAPEGFDKLREDIPHGKVETVEYDSKSVGNKRKMLVYTPPGYSAESKYPVLYLLHGIGGDEEEWHKHGHPEVILDNLYANKKIAPMIVVLPNGRRSRMIGLRGMSIAPPQPSQSSSKTCSKT